MKKLVFFIGIVVAIVFTVYCFRYSIIEGLRLTIVLNESGEIKRFKEGKIESVTSVKDGVIDGWEYQFYPNGILKSKVFYQNNQINGEGYSYFDTGNLKLKGGSLAGSLIGGQQEYYDSQFPKLYFLVDVDQEIQFEVTYDSDGNMLLDKMHGFPISPKLFYLDVDGNPVKFEDVDPVPGDVSDIYFVASEPEPTKLILKVWVNNRLYPHHQVNNMIKVPNCLTESHNDVFIESYILLEQDTINGGNIKYEIKRK